VIAHVYGHCDFFKNNAWFAHTNRRMLDEMANHATRVNRYIDQIGYDKVEQFIDACLSLEDLIDMYAPHMQCQTESSTAENKAAKNKAAENNTESSTKESQQRAGKFPAKPYMESFINPPDILKREARQREEKEVKNDDLRRFPEEPQRDVLLFLLEHAPLKKWQRDILSIIRDEAYYYAPQGQTKIMNEGWASYWHTTIMTEYALTDAEVVCYAQHHSGTVATSPNRLNPYKLGLELFRDIEERWNKGQFGAEYDDCDNYAERKNWDKKLGLGREKIFEVRRVHNDITFIDTFLTEDFCARHRMFSFAYNDSSEYYEIASRQFVEVKQQLLNSLTNHGRPFIYVTDGNFNNRGELYLKHKYIGIELKQDYAEDTLVNLQKLWSRPVHIETVVDDEPTLLTYDGKQHEITTI